MSLARGTKTWVNNSMPWELEYAMHCLGQGIVTAASCEFYYRLGRAHRDFEAIVIRDKMKSKSVIYG